MLCMPYLAVSFPDPKVSAWDQVFALDALRRIFDLWPLLYMHLDKPVRHGVLCRGNHSIARHVGSQVREHILRTQAQEISWQDLCTVCQGMDQDDIKRMVTEYESYNLWLVEHDANGHVRLMVEDLG